MPKNRSWQSTDSTVNGEPNLNNMDPGKVTFNVSNPLTQWIDSDEFLLYAWINILEPLWRNKIIERCGLNLANLEQPILSIKHLTRDKKKIKVKT